MVSTISSARAVWTQLAQRPLHRYLVAHLRLRPEHAGDLLRWRWVLQRSASLLERANRALYDDEAGSYRGHAKLIADHRGARVAYHELNLALLVASHAEVAAWAHGRPTDLHRYVVRPLEWLERSRVHRLASGASGVAEDMYLDRSDGGTVELWVKYTAEALSIRAGLVEACRQRPAVRQLLARWQITRIDEQQQLAAASAHGEFLLRAADSGYAPKYALGADGTGRWVDSGWHTLGRAAEALGALYRCTGELRFRRGALDYAQRLIALWEESGGPYFRDEEGVPCFDSDIAAPIIRGELAAAALARSAGKPQRRAEYIELAQKMADWLIARQNPDGSFPLRVFRDAALGAEPVGDDRQRQHLEQRTEPGSALWVGTLVAPGDAANIGEALVELAHETGSRRYARAALHAAAFVLRVQHVHDRSSPVDGALPSWREPGDPDEPWRSRDATYSADQGGLGARMAYALQRSLRSHPELYLG